MNQFKIKYTAFHKSGCLSLKLRNFVTYVINVLRLSVCLSICLTVATWRCTSQKGSK